MRWKSIKYKDGETRIKSGFLFFPKEIKGLTRWFEYAQWKQSHYYFADFSSGCTSEWLDTEWLDLTTKKERKL